MKTLTIDEVTLYLKQIIAKELNQSIDSINEHNRFHELGLDSINSIFLLEQVESRYQLELTPLYFWDHPTIHLFAKQIVNEAS